MFFLFLILLECLFEDQLAFLSRLNANAVMKPVDVSRSKRCERVQYTFSYSTRRELNYSIQRVIQGKEIPLFFGEYVKKDPYSYSLYSIDRWLQIVW